MSKNIGIFFDGTWNSPDQHDENGEACPTNVVKLFEATLSVHPDSSTMQIVHYVRGVGTGKLDRIMGGGFGYGISSNIKDGYKFLMSNYEPGDSIYIFGFSRGAYTARSLAGMIRNVGVLKRDNFFLVEEAYKVYKSRNKLYAPKGSEAERFRRDNAWGGETIKFLGVFDTVGALGAPFGVVLGWVVNKLFGCSFHDTQLSSIVENAYHALAKHEKRLPFVPTRMRPNTRHNPSNFEEVWFDGVHSDVGGGYVETGLSDIALGWMAEKAQSKGLGLDLSRINNPKFYPDPNSSQHNSQTCMIRFFTVLFVKLPSCIGIVLPRYKAAVSRLHWNGDFERPI